MLGHVMNRYKLVLWSLYSYASAIVFVVFTLYFSQWLVIDKKVPDFWFNATYIASSVLLLFTAPVAADIAEKRGTRLPWLRLSAAGAFLSFFLTGVIASFYPDHYILAAGTFTMSIWAYTFAAVFYNGLLTDIALPERYGTTAGWGQCSDWIGEISGVLITLPLVTGVIVLWGSTGRAQAFIPAALLYAIFSLPMLFLYRERGEHEEAPIRIREEYACIWKRFVELCSINGIGWFFLSFFLFNDAIITASNNFTIYLDRVFGVSDSTKSFLILGILASSAIGALASGIIVDRIGFKKALTGVLAGWMIILPPLALTTNFKIFAAIAIIMGIWFGAVWVVTRVLVARLSPPSMLNRAFTYYGLMERFSTLVGPLAWGLIVTFAPHQGNSNYHLAVLGMSVFVALGFLVTQKILNSIQ